MAPFRYVTLVWPGLPWLWLRGSLTGLVLAIAFAMSLDVAIVATWIWPGLVELPFVAGLWTGVAAVWLVATVSAAAAFPPPIAAGRTPAADGLFAKARDAYLGRDWLKAEMRLRELLDLSPTDGEGQLLLGTLFRRLGRTVEARQAFEKLARSDSGAAWRREIAQELVRLSREDEGDDDGHADVMPLAGESTTPRRGSAAA
ncbi:MAG: tetratricopeptide repeat protein [Pirellulales bacterium]